MEKLEEILKGESPEINEVEKILMEDPTLIRKENRFKQTALHLACIYRKVEICELLLNSGFNPDPTDIGKVTPLMLSAELGDVQTLTFLTGRNVDINAMTVSGDTALNLACRQQQWEAVRFLIEKGADVNRVSYETATPLIQVCRLPVPLEVVSQFLSHGADIDAMDGSGWTALMVSCHSGYHDLVELLLQQGASVVFLSKESRSRSAFTLAWELACQDNFRNSRSLRLLMAYHSDVNVIMAGHNALIDLCYKYYSSPVLGKVDEQMVLDLAELLLQHGSEVNTYCQQIHYGHTALTLAAGSGSLRLIRLLIRHGADVNFVSPQYVTALRQAISRRQVDAVRLLLEEGADVHSPDSSNGGMSGYLQLACLVKCSASVRLLLSYGAGAKLTEEDGRALFLQACQNCLPDIGLALLEEDLIQVEMCPRHFHSFFPTVPLKSSEEGNSALASKLRGLYEWKHRKSFLLAITHYIQSCRAENITCCVSVFAVSDLVRKITEYI